MDFVRHHLRPFNLFLVALTQGIVYFIFFLLPSQGDNQALVLFPNYLILFVFTTLLITAGGYVINDYFDVNSDLLNKKLKSSSESTLLASYLFFFILGFIFSIYIAYQIDRIRYVSIYLIAQLLLFLYSSYFKNTCLLGNVLVSFFTTGVLLVLIFAEYNFLQIQWLNGAHAWLINLGFFCFFMFWTNFVRELIKDIEDINGDRKAGAATFPVLYGIKSSKILASFLNLILLVTILVWSFYFGHSYKTSLLFSSIVLCSFCLMAFVRLSKLTLSVHAKKVSLLYKLMMPMGLIHLYLIMNISL